MVVVDANPRRGFVATAPTPLPCKLSNSSDFIIIHICCQ